MDLKGWNHSGFGKFAKIKRLLIACIMGIQRAVEPSFKPGLLKLELELKKELNEILNQEKILWFQKSREKWIKSGDWNTKFFHVSTLVHRTRNLISGLYNDYRVCVFEPVQLHNIVISYVKYLFKEDYVHGAIPPFPYGFPC